MTELLDTERYISLQEMFSIAAALNAKTLRNLSKVRAKELIREMGGYLAMSEDRAGLLVSIGKIIVSVHTPKGRLLPRCHGIVACNPADKAWVKLLRGKAVRAKWERTPAQPKKRSGRFGFLVLTEPNMGFSYMAAEATTMTTYTRVEGNPATYQVTVQDTVLNLV